jgi:hypothetical protein
MEAARHPAPAKEATEDREEALRKVRTKALIRRLRALDAILTAGGADGKDRPESARELTDARKAFEEVRPRAGTMPRRPVSRIPSLSTRRDQAGSTAPSARSSSKPNSAPVRPGAP